MTARFTVTSASCLLQGMMMLMMLLLLLRRSDFCHFVIIGHYRNLSLELSADGLQTAGFVIQPVQTIALHIHFSFAASSHSVLGLPDLFGPSITPSANFYQSFVLHSACISQVINFLSVTTLISTAISFIFVAN